MTVKQAIDKSEAEDAWQELREKLQVCPRNLGSKFKLFLRLALKNTKLNLVVAADVFLEHFSFGIK